MAGLLPGVQVDGRRSNLRELCVTREEAAALTQVASTLHGQGHADNASSLLDGLLVRIKRQGVYELAPITSLGLPPAVPQPALVLQSFGDLTLRVTTLSGTNPFVSDATYEATGRHEAARLATAIAAAGGLDLWRSSAAVWRKTVALHWAPQLQQLMATHGIGGLLQELEDLAGIRAAALRLFPEVAVAHWPLTAAEWAQVPVPCPGIGRSLPAVLQRSEAEAALLVARLPAVDAARLRAAALALHRLQWQLGVLLPAELAGYIISMFDA